MIYQIKKSLLGLSTKEALFSKRKFKPTQPEVQQKLETIIKVFIEGYNRALEQANTTILTKELDKHYDSHHLGFAYEGAGMYFAIMDILWPKKEARLKQFTDGPGTAHDYIATVGAGLAIAKAPGGARKLEGYMKKLDPMLAWCVPDGYGFYCGIFHPSRYIDRQSPPPGSFPQYMHTLFDAGLGRSLWWVKGAEPDRVAETISGFPKSRQNELWAAIGLAATYAGSISATTLKTLYNHSGDYQRDFLSGVPFAARMRQKGCNITEWTESVCKELLSISAAEAGDLIAKVLDGVVEGKDVTSPQEQCRMYAEVRNHLIDKLT